MITNANQTRVNEGFSDESNFNFGQTGRIDDNQYQFFSFNSALTTVDYPLYTLSGTGELQRQSEGASQEIILYTDNFGVQYPLYDYFGDPYYHYMIYPVYYYRIDSFNRGNQSQGNYYPIKSLLGKILPNFSDSSYVENYANTYLSPSIKHVPTNLNQLISNL